MRKSPILLAILLLVLGVVLCGCAATVAFAIIQVVRDLDVLEVNPPPGRIQALVAFFCGGSVAMR